MAWVSYQTDKFPPMTEADKKNNVSIIGKNLGQRATHLKLLPLFVATWKVRAF